MEPLNQLIDGLLDCLAPPEKECSITGLEPKQPPVRRALFGAAKPEPLEHLAGGGDRYQLDSGGTQFILQFFVDLFGILRVLIGNEGDNACAAFARLGKMLDRASKLLAQMGNLLEREVVWVDDSRSPGRDPENAIAPVASGETRSSIGGVCQQHPGLPAFASIDATRHVHDERGPAKETLDHAGLEPHEIVIAVRNQGRPKDLRLGSATVQIDHRSDSDRTELAPESRQAGDHGWSLSRRDRYSDGIGMHRLRRHRRPLRPLRAPINLARLPGTRVAHPARLLESADLAADSRP